MKIAYRREGHGPAVLLIHGVGGDASNWSSIVPRLRNQYDVISMDLRGHGASDRITSPVTAAELANDAVQVLDEAGVTRCRVVGFSLGGAVAQALTLDHPARVERLAVIATVCGRTVGERSQAEERIAFVRQHGTAGIAEANRERWFTDAFREKHPDVVEARVRQVRETDPASYLHAFTAFCTTDYASRLTEITVPTLIVAGEHDVAATPRMAALMRERIRGSQVFVLPGLRHSLLIEAPERIGELLEDFF